MIFLFFHLLAIWKSIIAGVMNFNILLWLLVEIKIAHLFELESIG
jgi:hypothetical protein